MNHVCKLAEIIGRESTMTVVAIILSKSIWLQLMNHLRTWLNFGGSRLYYATRHSVVLAVLSPHVVADSISTCKAKQLLCRLDLLAT